MLKNSQYIYDNVIIEDGINTTKKYCKKAQVGVDCTVKEILVYENNGQLFKDASNIAPTYLLPPSPDREGRLVWNLPKGTYVLILNEGIELGPNDTGYFIQRSSLNRSGVSTVSSLWDPGFTNRNGDVVNNANIRLNVDNLYGVTIEQNSRVAQLIIMQNEDAELYNGQFQGTSFRQGDSK